MYKGEQEHRFGIQEKHISQKAAALGLLPEVFTTQLVQANAAYDAIVSVGPFYGKDVKGQNPSFRVSSEPLLLPQRFKEELEQLGQDIYLLGNTLLLLPDGYRNVLGKDWTSHVPFSWRLDAIIDDQDMLYINEVQISDGGDARMIGLQLAYGLTTLESSTAGFMSAYIRDLYPDKKHPHVVVIRQNLADSPFATNAKRMQEFLVQASAGQVDFSLIDRDELEMIDWDSVDAVINYAYIREADLLSKGISRNKVVCAGDASYIGSKALFALIHHSQLRDFWLHNLGEDAFQRLRNYFIYTEFIENKEQIMEARSRGSVVKVYNSERLSILGAARGVFGPWNLDDEQWERAEMLFEDGCGLIEQSFIEPKKFPLLLRARAGKDLEQVEWYGRLCVKYVAPTTGRQEVALTGLEATLGRSKKPAGVGCCITATDFYTEN